MAFRLFRARALIMAVVLLLAAFIMAVAGPRADYHQGSATEGLVGANIDCSGLCKFRCSRASRTNLCLRACGTCCARCSCVPPGTSGNYQFCPCYAALTTHNGRRKCP
ncbi:Gibberellin-regulated protein 3 [Apostasia shenzhenica]|uniref:Gibberellin-regulated protein 3 n=1 Tax=Apostasia shenzhenica TaxID=1088818 RepID=A0A2I0AT63_9ASPA|nr:Gibberellin-regulated protein 3 [Apostasia shenzhenica]